MINVKLFVILSVIVVGANSSEYCKICTNHTLCKYPLPGPSQTCIGYDVSALLTRHDIVNIVNRINERRNLVALGLSKRLPTAANMRKISWSEDLAWSAQRWVDQCDQAVRPDNPDLCRDLEDKSVGQNIATIFGLTPGMSVKSFVDIWFMQTLDYSGDVTYYNQSQDAKTNDFTQLIWAETDSVGCGKARFQVQYNMEIERLVCNFAPSGNVHGKPVYALGIPATQCPDNCYPDTTYIGLCNYQTLSENILMFKTPPVTSLLRILNLANTTFKQEIDPIKNDLNQSSINIDENDDHRHHKSRHVVNSSSQGDMPHYIQQRPLHWNNMNDSRNFLMRYYPPELSPQQSRVYHGHIHRGNFVPPYTATTEPNFRKFDRIDLVTQPQPSSLESPTSANYRKYNQYDQCTRRFPVMDCNDRCTRGQSHACAGSPACLSDMQIPHVIPHSLCPCSAPTTCPPSPSPITCCETTTCCPCHAIPSPCCHKFARAGEPAVKDDTRKSGELHYYDLLSLRSNDANNEKSLNKSYVPPDRKKWLLRNVPFKKEVNKLLQHKRTDFHTSKNYDQVKYEYNLPSYNMEEESDISTYRSFDFKKRLKRESEEKTFKPFWKINDYENQHPLMLKSLQYTTLRNKKNRYTWRITPVTDETATEPITIEIESHDMDDQSVDYTQHSTEKYLSFDELLHLRKIHSGQFSARRAPTAKAPAKPPATTAKPPAKPPATTAKPPAKPPATTAKATPKPPATTTKPPAKPPATTTKATPKPPATTAKATPKPPATTAKATLKQPATTPTTTSKETPPPDYSTNTPFQRKKYCTRKLTCTWTVYTATASDGSIIQIPVGGGGGGGGGSGGSRTPPGYVEGCTRTSTCTRDYMNRNKISTIPMSTMPEQETIEDEDYCERRSLDLQRRNSNEKSERERIIKRHNFSKTATTPIIITKQTSNPGSKLSKANNCINCAVDDTRKKRSAISQNMLRSNHCVRKTQEQYKNPLMSYGDLYYLVLNKLMNTRHLEEKRCGKCPCAGVLGLHKRSTTVLAVFLIILYKLIVFSL